MGGSDSMHEKYEKYIQYFVWEIGGEEATRKT